MRSVIFENYRKIAPDLTRPFCNVDFGHASIFCNSCFLSDYNGPCGHWSELRPKDKYLVDSLDLSSIPKRDLQLVDSAIYYYNQCITDSCKVKAVSVAVEGSYDDNVWPKYNQWVHDFSLAQVNVATDSAELSFYQSAYAGALNNIGYLANSKGEMDTALFYYEKSLAIHQKMNNKRAMGDAFINLGYVYLNIGFIDRALEYYYNSLKNYEDTNNSRGISTALNAIGFVYYKQNETEKALENYNQSLEIRRALNNDYGIATCLNNIGLIYKDRGEWDQALSYYEKCLEIDKKLGDEAGIATSYGNIGQVYKGLGNTDKALEFYSKSLEINRRSNNKNGISGVLHNISVIELAKGNLGKARSTAEESLQLAQELNYPSKIRDAAQTLAEIEKNVGNWKKSLSYQNLYYQMKDSIFNKETLTSTINQQLKYKYEKAALADSIRNAEELRIKEVEKDQLVLKNKLQRRESYLLMLGFAMMLIFSALIYSRLKLIRKQKNLIEKQKEKLELRRKQNEAYIKNIHEQKRNLENLNEDLQQFAQIISHDLKAPLRGIAGLADMIEEDYPDLEDELKERLSLIKERSVKSNQLIKGILSYSKAGREAVTKEKVNTNDLFNEVLNQLENPKKVQIEIDSSCPEVYGNKYQLQQILANLIGNAIKYNHHENGAGNIKISCKPSERFHEFTIADNGPGIPRNMQQLVFDLFKKGHDLADEESSGIGLSIVKKLIKQNGGIIELYSKEGEGATFKFTWPI